MASVSGSDFVSGSDVSADAFSGTSQSYKATNVVSCHLLLCGAVLLIGSFEIMRAKEVAPFRLPVKSFFLTSFHILSVSQSRLESPLAY